MSIVQYFNSVKEVGKTTCLVCPYIPGDITTEGRYGWWMVLSYLFAFLFRFIPWRAETFRHFYMFTVGLCVYQWVYMEDWIHSMIVICSVYWFTRLCVSYKGGQMVQAAHPMYAFMYCMLYMTWAHVYQWYANPDHQFSFIVSHMWLTIKLTSFATYVYDGAELNRLTINPSSSTLRPTQKFIDKISVSAIYEMPSFLQMLGYCYCFTNILCGPSFTYRQYIAGVTEEFPVENNVNHVGHAADSDNISSSWFAHKYPLGSSVLYSLILASQGVICVMLREYLIQRYSLQGLVDPAFADQSMISKIQYYLMFSLHHRLLFYIGWKVFEGASVMAGFGYQNKSAECSFFSLTYWKYLLVQGGGWDGVSNMSIFGFELTPSIQCMKYWNKSTQIWLQNCIYLRTNNSLAITYFVNALWHGLDVGFYIYFGTLALHTVVERLIKSRINPIVYTDLPPLIESVGKSTVVATPLLWVVPVLPQCYELLCLVLNILFMSYAQVYFNVQYWKNCLIISQQMTPLHVYLLIAIALLYALPVKKVLVKGE